MFAVRSSSNIHEQHQVAPNTHTVHSNVWTIGFGKRDLGKIWFWGTWSFEKSGFGKRDPSKNLVSKRWLVASFEKFDFGNECIVDQRQLGAWQFPNLKCYQLSLWFEKRCFHNSYIFHQPLNLFDGRITRSCHWPMTNLHRRGWFQVDGGWDKSSRPWKKPVTHYTRSIRRILNLPVPIGKALRLLFLEHSEGLLTSIWFTL